MAMAIVTAAIATVMDIVTVTATATARAMDPSRCPSGPAATGPAVTGPAATGRPAPAGRGAACHTSTLCPNCARARARVPAASPVSFTPRPLLLVVMSLLSVPFRSAAQARNPITRIPCLYLSPHRESHPADAITSVPGGGGAGLHVGHDVHAGQHDENHHVLTHMHGFGAVLSARQLQGRRLMIAYVLEVGIVVHSVIIGVNLGVMTTGMSSVASLIIALSFHQASLGPGRAAGQARRGRRRRPSLSRSVCRTNALRPIPPSVGTMSKNQVFEGLGLGAAVAQAQVSRLKALLMTTTFAFTTPVGVAIGIGVASTYANDVFTAAVVKMTFNAISAGILVHLGLVDLLMEEFSRAELDSKEQREGWQRELMLLSAALGAGVMSVLALWA